MMRFVPVFVLSLAVLGCKPQANSEATQVSKPTMPVKAVPGSHTSISQQGKSMSLQSVVAVFTAGAHTTWSELDRIKEVRWNDSVPIRNDDVKSLDEQYSRSGKLVLTGYETMATPDEGVGADAGTREANEGESGITFTGNKDEVFSATVMKFGQESDYAEILDKQLGGSYAVKPLAAQCKYEFGSKANNESQTAFFSFVSASGAPAYAEMMQQDGGNSGPGYTLLTVYRKEPADRIKVMGCQRM